MAALIEIRDLSISANGKQILKHINMDINEVICIGIIWKERCREKYSLHLLRGFEEFEDITGGIERVNYFNSKDMHRKIIGTDCYHELQRNLWIIW